MTQLALQSVVEMCKNNCIPPTVYRMHTQAHPKAHWSSVSWLIGINDEYKEKGHISNFK